MKHFLKDPMEGKHRGSGFYYHRGNDYYSKYSKARDNKIQAEHRPQGTGYRHTGDTYAKVNRLMRETPRIGMKKAFGGMATELARITGVTPPAVEVRMSRPYAIKRAGIVSGQYNRFGKLLKIWGGDKYQRTHYGTKTTYNRPFGTSARGTFFHEFGHHLHYERGMTQTFFDMPYKQRPSEIFAGKWEQFGNKLLKGKIRL